MFTRLSRENAAESKINLDGVFVTEYLPFAPEGHSKIYLFGLACAYGLVQAPTLSRLAALLGTDEETVLDAFSYWEDKGLVTLHRAEETFVEYLPVAEPGKQLKKYSKEKYRGFNDQLHAMMPKRDFLPSEYNEYYYVMESLHIEVEAMLVIIGYCIRLKGESVHSAYILKVARSFAADGCITYAKASEKINEYDFRYNDLAAIFKALKVKKAVSPDDSARLDKWLGNYGFPLEVIIFVAGNVKKGGMDTLDMLLSRYCELRLFTREGIEAHEAERKSRYELMAAVVKTLGLRYESLDSLIETYLVKWQALGFTDDTLLSIASYCLQADMHTPGAMNGAVNAFREKGLISAKAIEEYIEGGERVQKILSSVGIVCAMNAGERATFDKWTRQWGLCDELIELAAKKALGKEHPVAFADKLLSTWFDRGVKTAAEAESLLPERPSSAVPVKKYTAEELDAMFGDSNGDKL